MIGPSASPEFPWDPVRRQCGGDFFPLRHVPVMAAGQIGIFVGDRRGALVRLKILDDAGEASLFLARLGKLHFLGLDFFRRRRGVAPGVVNLRQRAGGQVGGREVALVVLNRSVQQVACALVFGELSGL
ncbi:hypothetical protein [Accumulibacter sp.]|uniref:hypothetical protein n=1 Tax=Accumulibacter sp. TaxID=2053492 RepID=UPI00258FD021|nr:hypothetical protein [Accumulibacter sp.]